MKQPITKPLEVAEEGNVQVQDSLPQMDYFEQKAIKSLQAHKKHLTSPLNNMNEVLFP